MASECFLSLLFVRAADTASPTNCQLSAEVSRETIANAEDLVDAAKLIAGAMFRLNVVKCPVRFKSVRLGSKIATSATAKFI
jgi:hypothetical protein